MTTINFRDSKEGNEKKSFWEDIQYLCFLLNVSNLYIYFLSCCELFAKKNQDLLSSCSIEEDMIGCILNLFSPSKGEALACRVGGDLRIDI